MTIITPELIDRMLRTGPLAEARVRAQNGSARPRAGARWEKFSPWALICEEILDTEHPADWYDAVLAELRGRGFSDVQIERMRRFAWGTAGWLNYDKALWEWVDLDEQDIRKALDWQLDDGIITRQLHAQGTAFLREVGGGPQDPVGGA